MFEREIRDIAFVPRWGIIRTIRQQNVAEHSYFVAIYADQIAKLISWEGDRAGLLRLAIAHDWEEILSSDIAAPAKRVIKKSMGFSWALFEKWTFQRLVERIPDFVRWGVFSDEEGEREAATILKVADLLEAVLFLADEVNMGNNNCVAVKAYLEDGLWSAMKELESFTSVAARSELIVQMKAAIDSASFGCSKVVRGDEHIA